MKHPTPSSAPAETPAAHPRLILDIGDGLDHIMGDRALYFKLLRRFRHDNQGVLALIRAAIDTGRYAVAQLKTHTLKGAAGMIGAHTVYDRAVVLEAALRAQALTVEQPLQQLGIALDMVLHTIASILPELSDDNAGLPEGAPVAADAAMLELLERLAGHLREGDGAAIDLLENSATALAACLGVATYQAVAVAAREFDFGAALEALGRRSGDPGGAQDL